MIDLDLLFDIKHAGYEFKICEDGLIVILPNYCYVVFKYLEKKGWLEFSIIQNTIENDDFKVLLEGATNTKGVITLLQTAEKCINDQIDND